MKLPTRETIALHGRESQADILGGSFGRWNSASGVELCLSGFTPMEIFCLGLWPCKKKMENAEFSECSESRSAAIDSAEWPTIISVRIGSRILLVGEES